MENKELHRIASTAIIVKDGPSTGSGQAKYLITRRSLQKKAFPGKWHVPGGGLETDDYINTPADKANQWYFALTKSLRREIKEEVNLELKNLNYLLDLTFVRPDGIPVLVLSFWAYYKSGRIKLDDDNIDYKWVTLKEARDYNLIAGILGEIEMVDKLLKGADGNKIKYNRK
ncbi:MAG: NUDIX domain-containing protein [bacterium]